jgi:hypothetical protein
MNHYQYPPSFDFDKIINRTNVHSSQVLDYTF